MTDRTGLLTVQIMLDRSGSMRENKHLAVDGFNEFITQLMTATMPSYVSLSLFNHEVTPVPKLQDKVIFEVPKLTLEQFWTMGGTSIHSAIRDGLDGLAMVQGGTKALVVMTDGSSHCTLNDRNKAKRQVETAQAQGTLCLFLDCSGSGQAASYGFRPEETLNYRIGSLVETMQAAAQSALRHSVGLDASFTTEERKKAAS